METLPLTTKGVPTWGQFSETPPTTRGTPLFLGPRQTRQRGVWIALGALLAASVLWCQGDNLRYSVHTLQSKQSDYSATSNGQSNETNGHSNAHALHLLIPVSETSANLCKTLYSLTALNYPPPTLLNFGHNETDYKKAWTEKIQGMHRWLQHTTDLSDKDLVLMVDGYDVWFQLPPNIMIGRFKDLLEMKNENLRAKYGTISAYGKNGRIGRYTERVVFGADKICWPTGNAKIDLACSAVPESSLPEDSWGPMTDTDPDGYNTRPRWLNSGNIMGRAGDLKHMYTYAMHKVDNGDGVWGDQFILAQIFGEQEYQREISRLNRSTPWIDWLSNKIGSSKSPDISGLHMDTLPGQNYEFGIGIDYGSRLFFTMTHSHKDAEWIRYNDSDVLATLQQSHGIPNPKPIVMPLDLQRTKSPFLSKSADKSLSSVAREPALDDLPNPTTLDWSNIPLALNVHSGRASPILHYNGEKSYVTTWWYRMWYHPWARALLHKAEREPPTLLAKDRTTFFVQEGESFWNTRGGGGGAWTEDGKWMSWTDLCSGFEEEIFADGKGPWLPKKGPDT